MINISIVIITKGRHETLLRMLHFLLAYIPHNREIEIIVIEETNIPNPPKIERVKYVSIPERGLGFGYVRNLALKKAKGSIIIFIDDDVIISEKWFEKLIEPFQDEKTGAVGGSILPDMSDINVVGKCISFLGFPAGGLKRYLETNGQSCETELISTGNCAFRADLAKEVGGFDKLLRWGGEDQEFFSRMSSRSRTIFIPQAIVFHKQRDSLKEVFSWFVRRGKADFYVKCKNVHPLSALMFPLRSNFWLKVWVILLFFGMLLLVSGFAALSFAVFVPVLWNVLLWNRGKKALIKERSQEFPLQIDEIKNIVVCKRVKWTLFLTKLFMDMGQEIGKFSGFSRYLNHRLFSKPLVLTFHHIGAPDIEMTSLNSRYYCSRERFEQILKDSEQEGRVLVLLSEVIKRLKENPNSLYFEKLLVVSFDDGYLSTFGPLTELLDRGHYPFTIFVCTGFVGKTNQWDESKGYIQEAIMNWPQIKELSTKGFEIGSHTRNHIDLRINTTITRREIIGSLEDLESNLSDYVSGDIIFSYPYGAYDVDVIQIVKEAGYIGAVANYEGNLRPKTDPWQIPRFSVYSNSDWESISRRSRSLWDRELIKDVRDWWIGPIR